MSSLPRRLRIQICTIILSLGASGGVLWHEFRHKPRETEIIVLVKREASLAADNQLANTTIGSLKKGRIKELLGAYQEQEKSLDVLLPPDSVPAEDIQSMIYAAADSFGVEVALENAESIKEGIYRKDQFALTMLGEYHNVGAVLASIGNWERITKLEDFVAEPAKGLGERAGGAVQNRLDASSTLVVYSRASASTASDSTGAPRDSSANAPSVRYEKDENGMLWQYLYLPQKNKEVRVPVSPNGRAQAEAWLARNGGSR